MKTFSRGGDASLYSFLKNVALLFRTLATGQMARNFWNEHDGARNFILSLLVSLLRIYVLYRLLFLFYFASRIMKTAFGSLSILSLYFSLYVIFYLQFPSFSSRNTCYLYILRRRYAFVIIVSRFPVFRDSSEVISFFLFIHDISRSLYLQLHQIMRTKRCDLRMRILQVTLLSTKL